MIPTFILQIWLLGLLSLGIVGGAVYFGHEWQQRSWTWDPMLRQSVFAPDFSWNVPSGFLAVAIFLAVTALFGRALLRTILRVTRRKATLGDDPRTAPEPVSEQRLRRPDGSELRVQVYGPQAGTPIVLSHGWGLHGDEWNYLKREFAERFRLIVWDEPGLGGSTRPTNRDFSLEKLARDLEAVLDLAGEKRAIMLGHSIGGMITLTFCRLFPETLRKRVLGLVLTHTTPTNPVRTTSGAAFFTAIEKPVLVPLMYLTIALSPLIWLMNWLSYLNGSAHLSTKRSGFSGTETWEQIDFATQFQAKASPAVMARGMLGMMHYDATKHLNEIAVPTLVIGGNEDTLTKPEASEQIHAGIPHARLITLAPARHLGLLEHHKEYSKIVREFICAEEGDRQDTAA